MKLPLKTASKFIALLGITTLLLGATAQSVMAIPDDYPPLIIPVQMKPWINGNKPTNEVYWPNTSVEIEVPYAPIPISTSDRTKPLYEVYKNNYKVEVPVEWQWYIRDLAQQHGYYERIIYGCILAESCFDAELGDKYKGLTQISGYWIKKNPVLDKYRINESYSSRDLHDPYDNLDTLMEIWDYARDTFKIDLTMNQGYKDLLYWHNTGEYIKNVSWNYSDLCIKFSKELVPLQ